MYFTYEKSELWNVALEGITHDTRGTLESMCYGDMYYLSVHDIRNLFESLASYQWQYDSASESFVWPSPPPYGSYAHSTGVYQLRNLSHHDSSYALRVCSYCQSFDHDVHIDVYDESYARLNAMIEIMNEQHKCFIGDMREFGLLSETKPNIPSLRHEASLHDDCEFFLPLQSSFVDDVYLTGLEEVFDPLLTSLTFVAPSLLAHP